MTDYEFNELSKIARMVGNLNRADLLKYKTKKNSNSDNLIFFKMNYDKNIHELKTSHNRHLPSLNLAKFS